MGSSSGFDNREDGISAYALVELREDIRCCWLEISLPTPIAQNRASIFCNSCQRIRCFSKNNNNSSSTGEVIESTRNVRRDLPYSASLIEASVKVYCRTRNAETLGDSVAARVTPC